ncbi:MAG: hypothetical protein ABJR23_02355 [Paracoccaceae bacterium]
MTATIGTDYLTVARRHAELTGMSLKAALEYAIDRVLSTELDDYLSHDEDTEVETQTKNANALLPQDWTLNVCTFVMQNNPYKIETLVGFNLGLDGFVPTYVSIKEAKSVKINLEAVSKSGGRHYFGSHSKMGDMIMFRRHGNGIIFQRIDKKSGKPIGVKTSIATTSVPRIGMALDFIITAAFKEKANQ